MLVPPTNRRQPRHREDPKYRRGKSKRIITALTTDSDTGPDSPRGTDRDNWHLMKVSPRVYHVPDPNGGIAPSSPLDSPVLLIADVILTE